jgi:hypothetical protein
MAASLKIQAKHLLGQTEKKHGNRVIGDLRRLERKQFSVSCLPSFFKPAISFLAAVNITVYIHVTVHRNRFLFK